MIELALVVCLFLLLAMVLRFVQPELLYGLRRVLREVRLNKAVIDFDAGRPSANRELVDALARDGRPESREVTASSARRRANKLRELYRIRDPRRAIKIVEDKNRKQENARICITELADIVRGLAPKITPNIEFRRAIVPSGSLLRYIGRSVQESEGEVDLTEANLGAWYIANPVSIEQCIEMLIAVVEALAFRLQAEEDLSSSETSHRMPLNEQILRVERRLRAVIRKRYLEVSQDGSARVANPESGVRNILGSEELEKCKGRMEHARNTGDVNVELLDFLYFAQVETIIVTDWRVFEPVLKDKVWFATRAITIREAWVQVTQHRSVDNEDLVIRSCNDINSRVQGFVGW